MFSMDRIKGKVGKRKLERTKAVISRVVQEVIAESSSKNATPVGDNRSSKVFNPQTSFSPTLLSRVVQDICIEEEKQKIRFSELKRMGALYAEEISEDEDVYLVQTPADMDLNTVKQSSIDFDSSFSNYKCKFNKKRKKYNVYNLSSTQLRLNVLLPSKKSKCFVAGSYPLSGRIILQEIPVIKKRKAETIHVIKDDIDKTYVKNESDYLMKVEKQEPYVKQEYLETFYDIKNENVPEWKEEETDSDLPRKKKKKILCQF